MESIESKINSQEYKCKLSEHLTKLLKRTKVARNEAQVAFAFQSEIYNFIHNFLKIEVDFGQEENQTTLRHKFIGRMDAICNNLVIEYKRKEKLQKEKDIDNATKQISNYLLQLQSETQVEHYGVLTDGIKIRYVYFQNDKLHYTSFKNIDENDLNKVILSLINVNSKRFLPKNIVEDFKFNSPTETTLSLVKYLFSKLQSSHHGKSSMLFQEWKTLFHLSENDKGQNEDIKKRRKSLSLLLGVGIDSPELDYKALFALQTTYAIIIKLIACKVITKIEFNQNIEYFSDLSNVDSETLKDFFKYIEDGYIFQTGGVRNLLEGDFFSWYCSDNIWSEEEAIILTDMISILENYSSSLYTHGYTIKDIFIDLYMEIIPSEVRHSLGEFFTPAWLANYVVDKSVKLLENKDNYSAIDPCCGSGIFVISLIKNIIGDKDIISLTDSEKKNLLKEILERVKGVDINPLSVLTAKVSFYLAIKPLINNEDIEIPIYLGDSANIPSKVNIENIKCYTYVISTKKEDIDILLPSKFVESKNFFYSMSQIQAIIKAEDSDLVYSKFLNFIGIENTNDEIINRIKRLSVQLVELHKKDWDGIWIRIVANFLLVGRIGNIDLIVGNPPWVKWEFLPQEYANKIKELCISRHLFSGQTYMGAISLNICALIANVTASTWLSKNGILSFLMPQTLMTQDSYSGFRNFFTNVTTGERMYLQSLDDWTKSGNPFIDTTEKFMTYYYKNNYVDYHKDGIPIEVIKKKRNIPISTINNNLTFDRVKDYFEISLAKAYQFDKERTGYSIINSDIAVDRNNFDIIIGECAYKARSGVEFTPAEVYFIEPIEKSNNKKSYMFKSSKFKASTYKNTSSLPMNLETDYIRPVIKAPTIIPFGFKESSTYCVFPYQDDMSISVDMETLSTKAPNLFNYLIKTKNTIGKQSQKSLTIARGKEFYALSKVGEYTFSPNKVTFRDNTKLSASVVKKIETPWGELIEPICAKHCPYISQDKKGRDISEKEAYYLCGILNTKTVHEYFKATYSSRSFSINFNIKMPLYDDKNKFQRIIFKLAERATTRGLSPQIDTFLDYVYIKLCKSISNK